MANRYEKVRHDPLGGGEIVWLVVEHREGRCARVVAECRRDFDANEMAQAMEAWALKQAIAQLERLQAEATVSADEGLRRIAQAKSSITNGHADSQLVERG